MNSLQHQSNISAWQHPDIQYLIQLSTNPPYDLHRIADANKSMAVWFPACPACATQGWRLPGGGIKKEREKKSTRYVTLKYVPDALFAAAHHAENIRRPQCYRTSYSGTSRRRFRVTSRCYLRVLAVILRLYRITQSDTT